MRQGKRRNFYRDFLKQDQVDTLREINLKEKIFNFYLKNTKYINNWDLVDLSADKIVGEYLFGNPDCTTTLQGLPFKGTLKV